MSDKPDADAPLDEKLRAWLLDELAVRAVPIHWPPCLEKLVAWASTYQDGRALHDLITRYPRREKKA